MLTTIYSSSYSIAYIIEPSLTQVVVSKRSVPTDLNMKIYVPSISFSINDTKILWEIIYYKKIDTLMNVYLLFIVFVKDYYIYIYWVAYKHPEKQWPQHQITKEVISHSTSVDHSKNLLRNQSALGTPGINPKTTKLTSVLLSFSLTPKYIVIYSHLYNPLDCNSTKHGEKNYTTQENK